MGLSIESVSRCVFFCDFDADEDPLLSDEGIEADNGFPQRLDGQKPGVYKCDPTSRYSFDFGSYSRYGEWRDRLSVMALGVDTQTVFQKYKRYQGKPFFELIRFTDCDGAIGPLTSAKLLADFAKYHDKAAQIQQDGFLELYEQCRKAFEIARQNGFVIFL